MEATVDEGIYLIKYSAGVDEVYEEWYVCPKCKDDYILSTFKFCPNCGIRVAHSKEELAKGK